MIQLVIFDLDGTLINTIADLAFSTNYALQQFGYPPHAVEEYRTMVGNGINKLLLRALPAGEQSEAAVARLRTVFVPHYDAHNTVASRPYAGIVPLLTALQASGIKLAVASNKYQSATETIVARLLPTIRFAAVYGQREGVPVKPDPTIVHDILAAAAVDSRAVLYVGDTSIDMLTARAAGVASCGVTWGFRPRAELAAVQPQYIVDTPQEIRDIVYKTLK